jgi:hypothetical protein
MPDSRGTTVAEAKMRRHAVRVLAAIIIGFTVVVVVAFWGLGAFLRIH